MNQVFELAGDLVPAKVAHDLMRLIAEGAGEEDDDADSQLRSSAVRSCTSEFVIVIGTFFSVEKKSLGKG